MSDLIRDEDHNAIAHEDFMKEEVIQDYFTGKFTSKYTRATESASKDDKQRVTEQIEFFKKWYMKDAEHLTTYGHHEKIGGKFFDCNNLTDEWFKWWLTTPVPTGDDESREKTGHNHYQDDNARLLDKRETFVYLAKALPFETPYIGRIIMTRKAPLLVPVYTVLASEQHSPSSSEKELTQIVMDDLAGVNLLEFRATLDGEPIHGCCTIRQKPMEISNIPEYNVSGIPEDRLRDSNSKLKACHGGFWLLIREKMFKPGDHLLKFEVNSKNYEMQAKILIHVLV